MRTDLVRRRLNKLLLRSGGQRREPGAPLPNEDHRQLSTGPLLVGHSQPRWIRELNEPMEAERKWLIENGLWCG